MSFTLHWENHGVHKRRLGFVASADFIRSCERVQADPRFDTLDFVIDDFSQARAEAIAADALLQVGALQLGARLSNPDLRVFYVAADPGFEQRYRETIERRGLVAYETRFFACIEHARDWIAANPPRSPSGRWLGLGRWSEPPPGR